MSLVQWLLGGTNFGGASGGVADQTWVGSGRAAGAGLKPTPLACLLLSVRQLTRRRGTCKPQGADDAVPKALKHWQADHRSQPRPDFDRSLSPGHNDVAMNKIRAIQALNKKETEHGM